MWILYGLVGCPGHELKVMEAARLRSSNVPWLRGFVKPGVILKRSGDVRDIIDYRHFPSCELANHPIPLLRLWYNLPVPPWKGPWNPGATLVTLVTLTGGDPGSVGHHLLQLRTESSSPCGSWCNAWKFKKPMP